jgi:hypothetical protein
MDIGVGVILLIDDVDTILLLLLLLDWAYVSVGEGISKCVVLQLGVI